MCSLPLVQRRRAPGAVLLPVLAAQSGGARHVVVGDRWRLHGLQGLEVCVASAAGRRRGDKNRAAFSGAA